MRRLVLSFGLGLGVVIRLEEGLGLGLVLGIDLGILGVAVLNVAVLNVAVLIGNQILKQTSVISHKRPFGGCSWIL